MKRAVGGAILVDVALTAILDVAAGCRNCVRVPAPVVVLVPNAVVISLDFIPRVFPITTFTAIDLFGPASVGEVVLFRVALT